MPSLPKIVYPSGVGTTLQFIFYPRFQTGGYKSYRHDNRASSGVQERIWESTDTLVMFTMEYVKGNFSGNSVGTDVTNWDSFVRYALQGGAFDYYPDPIGSPTDIRICFLEHTDYNPRWKQLGMFTFDMVFRYRVGWPSAPPSGGTSLTSFQDTFNRTGSSRLGSNWFVGTLPSTPITNPIWTGQATIATITGGIQGLSWQPMGNGSEQTAWPALAIPIVLSAVAGRNQYSQIKRVKFSAGVNHQGASGPSLLANENGFYHIVCTGPSAEIGKLYKLNGATRVQLHAGVTIADNDIARLEATLSGSTVTLKAFINGALQYTVVDTGSSLIDGIPSLYFLPFNEAQSGELYEYINFDGGVLS